MTTSAPSCENVVYVEYCRSCQTHSWCTHHDEAKYHDTFLKLSQIISEQYPHLEVIGNMVPHHLIPFKIAENKYIDSHTNKYIVYPQIGSFEVRLNNTLIFSKKETNAWPHLSSILNKISSTLNPDYQSPKKEAPSKSPKKTVQNTPSKALKYNQFLKESDQKKTHYKEPTKDPTKGFTLTDHFKLYRPKQKIQDKDWLTEKQESQGSYKQISEFGRGDSREKSDLSEQSRSKLRDFSGQSKLKEMLKNRGLMIKDHGKKQMIIKLDSIEEENGCYDDNGMTQRTAEKPTKKSKMHQLEADFSSLENKFIKFESKVKDIHTHSSQFQYKQSPSNNKSRGKIPGEGKKKDQVGMRNLPKQLPPIQKQIFHPDRQIELDEYLNATQAQKNQKLHRIYGQWKLIKQTTKKNRQLLKNKKKSSQNQPSSDEQRSNTLSNSRSSNIITFKPKFQKNIEKQITNLINNPKSHKYSTQQKFLHQNNNITSEPHFRTQANFYHSPQQKKPNTTESDRKLQSINKLLKTNNTVSLQALQPSKNKQRKLKLSNIDQELQNHFSQNAKQTINKIHARISKIQEKLHQHKQHKSNNGALLIQQHEYQPIEKPRKVKKSSGRSNSSSSEHSRKHIQTNSSKSPNKHVDKQTGKTKANPHSIGKKLIKAMTNPSNPSIQRHSNKSEIFNKPRNTKQSRNQTATIQEENELNDSSFQTPQQEDYNSSKHPVYSSRNNEKSKIKQKVNHTLNSPNKSQERQPKLHQQPSDSDSQDKQQNHSNVHEKSSRIHKHQVHEPEVFLRKKKDWRQSQSVPHHKRPKHISQGAQADSTPQKQAFQNSKVRLSENKETVSKPKKHPNHLKQQHFTPRKQNHQDPLSNSVIQNQTDKAGFGKIKKNKRKDLPVFKQTKPLTYNNTTNVPREMGQQQIEMQNQEQEQNSNPTTPQPDSNQSERQSRQEYTQRSSGEEKVENVITNSGKIIPSTSKKSLAFYKSQQVCYEGRKRDDIVNQPNHFSNSVTDNQQNSSSLVESQRHSRNTYQQEREQKSKQSSNKTFSNNKVQGWKMNEEEDQIESQSQYHNNTQTPSNSNSVNNEDITHRPFHHRNSLERQLEAIENINQQETRSLPLTQTSVTNKEQTSHEIQQNEGQVQGQVISGPSKQKEVSQKSIKINSIKQVHASSQLIQEIKESSYTEPLKQQKVSINQQGVHKEGEKVIKSSVQATPSSQQKTIQQKYSTNNPIEQSNGLAQHIQEVQESPATKALKKQQVKINQQITQQEPIQESKQSVPVIASSQQKAIEQISVSKKLIKQPNASVQLAPEVKASPQQETLAKEQVKHNQQISQTDGISIIKQDLSVAPLPQQKTISQKQINNKVIQQSTTSAEPLKIESSPQTALQKQQKVEVIKQIPKMQGRQVIQLNDSAIPSSQEKTISHKQISNKAIEGPNPSSNLAQVQSSQSAQPLKQQQVKVSQQISHTEGIQNMPKEHQLNPSINSTEIITTDKIQQTQIQKEHNDLSNEQNHLSSEGNQKSQKPNEQPLQQQQGKVIKKQKNTKHYKEKNKQKLIETKRKQVQIKQKDLQLQISKQYSDFICIKTVNELMKTQKPQLPVESKEYPDTKITLNVIYCPSAASIAESQSACPTNFLLYTPSQQLSNRCLQEDLVSQSEDIEQSERFQETTQNQEIQSEKTSTKLEQVQENHIATQPTQQPTIVKANSAEVTEVVDPIKPNQTMIIDDVKLNPTTVIDSTLSNPAALIDTTNADSIKANQAQTVLITPVTKMDSVNLVSQIDSPTANPIIVGDSPKVNPSAQIDSINNQPKRIADPSPLQTVSQPQRKQPSKANQSKLASPSPLSLQQPQIQQLKQINNVYCQSKQKPKQRSNVQSIGVQKELTLQVSIQTDHESSFPVFTPLTNTLYHKDTYQRQPSRESSKPPLRSIQSSKSEYRDPILDNYLADTKKVNFNKKSPNQIERALIIDKIYSPTLPTQYNKFAAIINGHQEQIHKEKGLVIKLQQLYPNGTLINQKSLQIDILSTKLTKLLKVVQILCEKSQWLISRLFQDQHGILKDKAFGVWLCKQYEWQCFIVDQNLKVDQDNHPIYSLHQGNQMWFNVLEKALAAALGGYEQLAKADTSLLFTMLTGCNSISTKIKEDPTKNSKLLYLIADCLKKNYIIHAEKNWDKNLSRERQLIYYINSIRKSGQEETLLELCQDGKENFWIKLSKFVQEFHRIDILHLRINHHFAHLDLGRARPGQLTVVELEFHQQGQGCVTLCYLGESGPLRAYLYRQEKNKVLKLVGQAKQKQKSHLFFECYFTQGRYYVFAQAQEQRSARIAFLGEGQPSLRITQEIHTQGLKNDMAEYLPIKDSEENKKRPQLQSMSDWRVSKPRLKDNFFQTRLRQNFVDYVLGRSKRN